MRSLVVTIWVFLMAIVAFGQTGVGTITGTVQDPAGAVVAGADVVAKNTDTGIQYKGASTATGNYTIAQLPPGPYQINVMVPGFRTYTRSGVTVQVAQVLRLDVALEVGASTETVTVRAEATMLRTESGDLAQNITVEALDDLPILGIGNANAGSSGIRNPYGLALLVPGTNYSANFTMVVNGAPSNTAGYRIEGQDMTNHFVSFALQEMQPSADAIQEVAVQTSNYSPEFGTAGGGLFNITMKSGTNQFHGSGYDYFVNEALNAGYPFSNNGAGNKVRPRNRRNDYGGTLGGPVWIPKLYNGHDKTFFFFNWEEFLETSTLPFSLTVPTAAYRQGDFSAISPNGGTNSVLLGVPQGPLPAVDALNRPIYANTIYDPSSERPAPNGGTVRDPFQNNIIPQTMISPVAQKIQSLFPNPINANYVNNAVGTNLSRRTTVIPSLKIDQVVGSKGRLSFYWSQTQTDSQYSSPNGNADGLPDEISGARGTFFHYWVARLNYDHTLSPTLLLHLGAGYNQIFAPDTAPYTSFNAQQQLGVAGFQSNRNFPYISGMCPAPPPGAVGCGPGLGGMQPIGTSNGIQSRPYSQKPSANASSTGVHGNHTFKAGGEVYFQGAISNNLPAVLLAANSPLSQGGATGLTFTPLSGLGGQSVGFGYANFLLGDFVTLQQNVGAEYRIGKSQLATFLQDSWKVTRKLTVDYGFRWDYGTYGREQYGRAADFSPSVVNSSAGGHLGGSIFEATCQCTFADNYPYAIGPRLGVAYQITPKTVLRAGWGVVYGFTADVAGSAATSAINGTNAPGAYTNILAPGALPQPRWPVYNPSLYPQPGTVSSAPQALDRNAGRPPRQNQWSLGLQREIRTNLVVEAAYVGNRGVWWSSSGIGFGANLGYLNEVSPATFQALGLDPYHIPADNALLSGAISSKLVTSRVGNVSPYPGFPASQSLLNALRPFPQFSAVSGGFGPPAPLGVTGAPTGDTWYDSLQAKATKRFSHGLQATGTFTWSKALISTRQNFWDPTSSSKTYQNTDQPFLLNANIVYTVPKLFENHSALSWATRDWQVGAFLQYASGLPLTPPNSNTPNPLMANNGGTTANYQIRVPGQPLYLKNPNCGCINPYQDQVLNAAAWTSPPVPGMFGTNALYGDFRAPRRPQENFNIGRNFRVKERYNLQIRAEFVNIFNRTYLGNPSTTLPVGNTLTRNLNGQLIGGFGVINDVVSSGAIPSAPSNGNYNTALGGLPRTGTVIARFTF
jgi:hypothetical protein